MALISSADQDRLRETLAALTRPVKLLFFTQTFGCETCVQARQILDELPPLSDKVTIEEVNFVLEQEKARELQIEAVPAVAILYEDGGSDGSSRAFTDSHMRFLGTPSGYEFISLVQAIVLAGGGESILSAESRARVAAVDRPITMQVFTTPTCPHCPRAVLVAHEMAFLNPKITAIAVEATEFPELARRYMVNGVPKTVVNDEIEILGALPADDFVEQALAAHA